MKKFYDVEPFKYTYRLYNRLTRQTTGDFQTFDEIFKHIGYVSRHDFCDSTEETKWVRDRRYLLALVGENDPKYRYGYDASREGKYVVLTNIGDVVPAKEVVANFQGYRSRKYDDKRKLFLDGRLVRRDGRKIKTSYARVYNPSGGWYCSEHYDNPARGYHRAVRTLQEIRTNVAHADEYGEGMIRGRRRYLPNSWDDVQCAAWDVEKSWKHHSKRRKQWLPR